MESNNQHSSMRFHIWNHNINAYHAFPLSVLFLIDGTQIENEMQVWTRRMADKTNRDKSVLRREMNEKLKKKMREVKNGNQSLMGKFTNKLHQE